MRFDCGPPPVQQAPLAQQKGLRFLSLHLLLESTLNDHQHIDEIGERVARLGAVPTARPVTQHELSYIKCEPEGRYSIRDFLRNDLEHELKIQQMMRKTIERAHQLKDYGTVQVLEDILVVPGKT